MLGVQKGIPMSFEFKLPPEELAKLDLPPPPAKRKLPSRGVMVGGLLSVIAGAILLRSFVFTTGYNTTLVANLGVVRAPMSGVVRDLTANAGDRVRRDEQIGTFAAPVGLAAAVKAGSEDVGQLTLKLASLDARMQALRDDAAHIRGEAQSYRGQKISQLSAAQAEAGADLAAAAARLRFAEQQLRRVRILADKGFVSAAGLDKAVQDRDAAAAARGAASARQENETIQTQAARQGLLLASGYSDVQYSTQRLSDLTLALNQLQGERDATAAALALAQQLSRASGPSVSRQLQLPLRASLSGRVWAKTSAAGESVREGDALYMLADCGSFFAYFTVGRHTYSTLAVGKPVTFVPLAAGDRWSGTIVNMGVSDAAQLRVTSQIAAPGPDEYLIGARVVLPAKDQQACPVGIAGRIVL
jgi:biotin carboxyl carrier protein